MKPLPPLHQTGAGEKSSKPAAWREIRTILYALFALSLSPFVYYHVFADLPPKFSVQLTGTEIQGLDTVGPAAASLTTVFNISLHASNKRGRTSACYRHGEVVVRYSGFTLAWGQTRIFCVGAKDTREVPIVAWADGVGLPKLIGDRLAEELRLRAGKVELELNVKLFAKADTLGAEPTWMWCKVVTGGAEPADVIPCSVFRSEIWASDFAPRWMLV